jgi:sortase A
MAAARLKFGVAALLIAAGVVESTQGVYIHAKAALAQVLLQRAWQSSLASAEETRPWPWADTWPVARLRAPKHGIDQIVLAGVSGNVLAFAPGHVQGSAAPGERGHSVISAHRDTHFRFLKDLKTGDALYLTSRQGREHRYRVTAIRIVDTRITGETFFEGNGLTLVTCYPFDAVVPGGPLRYLVDAEADPEPEVIALARISHQANRRALR